MTIRTTKHRLAGWDTGYIRIPPMTMHQHKTFCSPVSVHKSLKKLSLPTGFLLAWLLKSESSKCSLSWEQKNHKNLI